MEGIYRDLDMSVSIWSGVALRHESPTCHAMCMVCVGHGALICEIHTCTFHCIAMRWLLFSNSPCFIRLVMIMRAVQQSWLVRNVCILCYMPTETALSGVVRRNYGCFGLNTGIQYGESGLS